MNDLDSMWSRGSLTPTTTTTIVIQRNFGRGQQAPRAGHELYEVCRHLQIAESTWHRWAAQYGGMKASDAKRFKELTG